MAKPRDEEANLAADFGNERFKDKVVTDDSSERTMIHALDVPSDAAFAARVTRAKHHPHEALNSVIFEKDGIPYIVGEMAENYGSMKKFTGAKKYVKGYWDVMLSARLLDRYPYGHNNINIAIAHPSDAIPYLDEMINLMLGKHKVKTVDGREVTHIVREVFPYDEPNGGLLRWEAIANHEYGAKSLKEGNRLLVIDIGGKISSMTAVLVGANGKLYPQYPPNNEGTFNLGIQDVMGTLRMELRAQYPVFKAMNEIPPNMIHEALMHRQITLSNKPMSVEPAVRHAIKRLLDDLKGYYADKMGGGLNFNHIIVTGGGGGLLYDYMVDPNDGILNHDFVGLADKRDQIHLANVRGGAIAFAAYIKRRDAKLALGKK